MWLHARRSVFIGMINGERLCGLQLWRFQGWVQRKVDVKLAALEQAAKPTIGFHIRGGDKGEEDVLRVRMRALHRVPHGMRAAQRTPVVCTEEACSRKSQGGCSRSRAPWPSRPCNLAKHISVARAAEADQHGAGGLHRRLQARVAGRAGAAPFRFCVYPLCGGPAHAWHASCAGCCPCL